MVCTTTRALTIRSLGVQAPGIALVVIFVTFDILEGHPLAAALYFRIRSQVPCVAGNRSEHVRPFSPGVVHVHTGNMALLAHLAFADHPLGEVAVGVGVDRVANLFGSLDYVVHEPILANVESVVKNYVQIVESTVEDYGFHFRKLGFPVESVADAYPSCFQTSAGIDEGRT